MRSPAYRAFARATGANLAEAELPLASYRSLGDFFARKLRPGARTIDIDPASIACPCDGVLASTGSVVRGSLVQAKGHNYELGELVADDALARTLDGGSYATIYLAPRDYHRVHAPIAGRLVGADVVPGERWPVNPRVAARRDRLFARNERVVMRLDGGPLGPFVVVMVAATGVGHIQLAAGVDSRKGRKHDHRRFDLAVDVARGDELGMFRLGSTVIVVFERGAVTLGGRVGEPVRFGERLGTTRRVASAGEVVA